MEEAVVSLTELKERKRQLEAERSQVEALIQSHPENITQYFPGLTHPIIKRVGRVERITGWTDSIKNPIQYEGFCFELDGVPLWVRHGSNWCSDFTECGPDKEECGRTLPFWDQYEWDDPDIAISEAMHDIGEVKAIALALLVLNEIVG